ncbi:MAG: AraC family transcriptional regulator [Pirellulales bacterium]|nr:AraC family transcriptional regulator [Pirellulales bacterium]
MRSETQDDYHARMLRVLVCIQERLDEPLSLEELAREACFSPFHFHRLFRAMVGESVKEYVRRLRLERAAFRLATTDRAIVSIALDAGYETHESFTRAFRGLLGVAPSEYRKRVAAERLTVVSEPSVLPPWERKHFSNAFARDEIVEVRLEKRNPMRVAFVRHVGPYQECGYAWEKLCAFAGPQGWLGPGVETIGVCHDDPDVTPTDKLRYDACLPAPADFDGAGEIGVQEIAGGEYAVTTHRGPYSNLAHTYQRLFHQWLPQSRRELRSSPCLEIYRNDPATTPPEQLATDIYVPLEQA